MIVKFEYQGRKYRYNQVQHIGEHIVHLPKLPTVEGIKIKPSMSGLEDHHVPYNECVLNIDESDPMKCAWNRQFRPNFFNHYLPGETEIWAEETEYRKGMLAALNEDDTRELLYYFDREIHRRQNGVHMVNGVDENGEYVVEWLTEDHYFFMQDVKAYGLDDKNLPWWRDKGYEYGEYREFQRDIFQLIWKVKNDPDILGLFVAKPKKTGVTQMLAAYYLNKATLSRMKQMGIMSKGNDAAGTNMLFFFHAFDGLPQIFKPTTRDRADVDGKIFFAEPAIKSISTKRGMERYINQQTANPLNTKVYAAKTKEAGFDSPVMSDIWLDEFPKYDTENKQQPEVVWNRNQEAIKLQDFYNGRCWITSYPPETDTLGFFQAKKLYYESKLSTVKPGGKRTASGLICIHISALNAYNGCFDRWGKCDSKLAAIKNKEERDQAKDKKQHQSKVRQYSETEQECWSATGAGSTFDAVRVGELITDLEEEMRGTRLFEDGRLEWENSLWEVSTYDQRPRKRWCNVNWKPLTKEEVLSGEMGRKRYYQPIPMSERNAVLRNPRDRHGNLMPPVPIMRLGGTDPTDYAAGEEVIAGSKNASFTMNMPDLLENHRFGAITTKVILSEYLYRPDNPMEFYEDLVKEIIFEGKIVLVEANRKWVATKLIQDGLGRFLMVQRKDNGKYALWTPALEKDPVTGKNNYGLISADADALESIVRVISKYIVKPKEGDANLNYGATIKSERLLDQMSRFNKEKSKLFDLVMAFGWTLILMEILMTEEEVQSYAAMYEQNMVTAIYNGLMQQN